MALGFQDYLSRAPRDPFYSTFGPRNREAAAMAKGELSRAIGGRDYWEQFQQDRFLRLTSAIESRARKPSAPQVLSGMRRGVGTSGAEGVYAGQDMLQAPSITGSYARAFEGATNAAPGLVDPKSLSVKGREQLRNVAFEQFFDPRLSGQQEQLVGGASKLAGARGLRGRAVSGAALSMANRFLAGNRRGALSFITSDIQQTQQGLAANNMDPQGRLLRDEAELKRLLSKSAAFMLLSRNRQQFNALPGMDPNRQAASAALGGSLMGDLRAAAEYTGKLIPGFSEGGIASNQPGAQLGTSDLFSSTASNRFAGAIALSRRESAARQLMRNVPGTERTRGQTTLDFLTGTLERDLFSEGSYASAGDIAAGAFESSLQGRAGYQGETTDFRRLFQGAFGISNQPGEYNPLLRLQQAARSSPGQFGTGGRGGTPWMTPELAALRVGTGSQRDIQARMGFIQQQMARNMDAAGRPFVNQTALYNSYNAQMRALQEGSEYLTNIRSRYLSPLSF